MRARGALVLGALAMAGLVPVGAALGTMSSLGAFGASSAGASARGSGLIRAAHVTFESCPARTTLMTASVLALSFRPNQPVLVAVTVRNQSAKACGTPGAGGKAQGTHGGSTVGSGLWFGPCGNVSMQFDNVAGVDVYPGASTAPSCAAPLTVRLRAHQSVSATAIWDQQNGLNSPATAPRGLYTIVIANKIVFHITLTGANGALPSGPSVVPVPGLGPRTTTPTRPPGPCGRTFNLIAAGGTTSSTTTTVPKSGPRCPIGEMTPQGGSNNAPTPTVPPQPNTPPTTPGSSSTKTVPGA